MNMNSKKYFLLITLLLFLFSCSTENENNASCKKLLFSNNHFALCDSIDFKFIPLQTTNECLIGSISDIKIANNKIFVGDIHKSNAIFVFDMNGKFITKVGNKGNAPNQYLNLFGFDIDKERQIIVLDDRQKKRLLYYDLDSFEFKYAQKIDFDFANFQLLKDENIGFFNYKGFENESNRNKSYLLITNSTGKAIKTFYDCTFSTSETLSNTPNRIYTLRKNAYVFHHLFPYIYKIEDNGIVPIYELNFDTFKFPDLAYLDEKSKKNKDYTNKLESSNIISSYGIYETTDLICCPFICKRQFHIGLYNKRSDTGYLFSVPDFYKDSRLGVFINPKGSTEEFLISTIDPQDISKVKKNSILSYLSNKVTTEDNPVICLLKLK